MVVVGRSGEGSVEVPTLPVQAGPAGGMVEKPVAGEVADFPDLAFLVELDGGGAVHGKPSDLEKIDGFGVETGPRAVGSEVQHVRHTAGGVVTHDWIFCCFLVRWVVCADR